jgi:nucleoside-diphosphate-sugar epimerase
MRVAITGASGRLGRRTVAEFLNAGYEVRAVDRVPPSENVSPYCLADIRDLGQMCGALYGCDMVAHLAAIPAPVGHPQEEVFAVNVMGTFNVLEAAKMLGISRVVTISSVSALGVAWATHPVKLLYVPVDEDHPLLPQDAYGLSKQVGEDICRAFHRLTGGDAVSLRFPVIWDSYREPNLLNDLAADERSARTTMWSYIHVDDAAHACRLALETPGLGADVFYVSAPDTFADRPSAEIARQHFPDSEIRGDEKGRWAFHDCSHAARLLSFKAEHLWSPR